MLLRHQEPPERGGSLDLETAPLRHVDRCHPQGSVEHELEDAPGFLGVAHHGAARVTEAPLGLGFHAPDLLFDRLRRGLRGAKPHLQSIQALLSLGEGVDERRGWLVRTRDGGDEPVDLDAQAGGFFLQLRQCRGARGRTLGEAPTDLEKRVDQDLL